MGDGSLLEQSLERLYNKQYAQFAFLLCDTQTNTATFYALHVAGKFITSHVNLLSGNISL